MRHRYGAARLSRRRLALEDGLSVRQACRSLTPLTGARARAARRDQNHDQLRRTVNGRDGVRVHRGELRRLPRVDIDLPLSQPQSHTALKHEEPVVSGVHLLALAAGGGEPDRVTRG